MGDVTRILSAIESGNPQAASDLLPLVYDELRRLAAQALARERPGQTLQATALVHEVYLRLVGEADAQRWRSRGHFFAAAAEAMRRILVENARRKKRVRHGGEFRRVELDDAEMPASISDDDLLAIDESLDRLAAEEPAAAELIKLRFFAGFSLSEAAEMMGISRTTAYEQWAYARAWLRCDVEGQD
jgi:RNA polymerase sigma factor (TIGR02999 family)